MDEFALVPLSKIEGQTQALATLRGLIEAEELPPPLLFHGPEGCGKRTSALAFAAALVCRQRRGSDACACCSACQRVTQAGAVTALRAKASSQDSPMAYPDIGFVSLPQGKTRISILQSRDLCRSLMLRPFELSYRVYIIEPADRLTLSAANALLKVLEEPPSFGVILLVTAAPWSLPITIRSRMRAIRFVPLAEEIILRRLMAEGHPIEEARKRARWARGSLSRALELDAALREEEIGTWVSVLEQAGRGASPGALAVSAAEGFAGDATRAERSLELLEELLRDIAAAAQGSPPLMLSEDQLTRLAPCEQALLGAAGERIEVIDRLAREIRVFNRNPRLAIEGAVLALCGVIRREDLPAS